MVMFLVVTAGPALASAHLDDTRAAGTGAQVPLLSRAQPSPCPHPDSWKLPCIRVDGKMRRVVILIFATTVLSENPQNCTADIYESIRDKYESCANDKILTITATIQSSPQHLDQENIICSAVKELINDCGEVLNGCFSAIKIEETKSKQKDGIMKILKTHYTETELKDCFLDDKFKSERERKSFTPVTTSVSLPVDPEAIYEALKTNSSSLTTVPTSTFTTTNTSASTATGKEDSVRIREQEAESLTAVISSSPVFEEEHQEFTPASTTVDDDNKIEKEETVTLHTENVLKYSSTESFSIIGDQGTTPR